MAARRDTTLVPHAHQKQSFSGRGKTSCASLIGVKSRDNILNAHFAKRAFYQRTDD